MNVRFQSLFRKLFPWLVPGIDSAVLNYYEPNYEYFRFSAQTLNIPSTDSLEMYDRMITPRKGMTASAFRAVEALAEKLTVICRPSADKCCERFLRRGPRLSVVKGSDGEIFKKLGGAM